MPLDSTGPQIAMLTPILGKMLKTCQFSGAYLAAKSNLAGESPVFLLQAARCAQRDDFWFGHGWGWYEKLGLKVGDP
jgi:hypothetical protein